MTKRKAEPFTAVIRDQEGLSKVMVFLSDLEPSERDPFTIRIAQEDESRSLKQNRLAFMWYQLRGSITGHGKIHERCLCKRHYGCPILQRDDADFAKFFHKAIVPLAYEQQLDAMEYVPVTSLMGVKQFAEYLNSVDQESVNQGIVLPHPEDLYWSALMLDAEQR